MCISLKPQDNYIVLYGFFSSPAVLKENSVKIVDNLRRKRVRFECPDSHFFDNLTLFSCRYTSKWQPFLAVSVSDVRKVGFDSFKQTMQGHDVIINNADLDEFKYKMILGNDGRSLPSLNSLLQRGV